MREAVTLSGKIRDLLRDGDIDLLNILSSAQISQERQTIPEIMGLPFVTSSYGIVTLKDDDVIIYLGDKGEENPIFRLIKTLNGSELLPSLLVLEGNEFLTSIDQKAYVNLTQMGVVWGSDQGLGVLQSYSKPENEDHQKLLEFLLGGGDGFQLALGRMLENQASGLVHYFPPQKSVRSLVSDNKGLVLPVLLSPELPGEYASTSFSRLDSLLLNSNLMVYKS
jgi:hypothetical protein